jgi:hypothetical protein
VDLPTKLVKRTGEVIEFLGFGGEEELIKAAVRRLRDEYAVLIGVVARNR